VLGDDSGDEFEGVCSKRSGRSPQFTELRDGESCANWVSRRISLDRALSRERMLVFEACFGLLASRS